MIEAVARYMMVAWMFACGVLHADEGHALALAHADSITIRPEDRVFTRWLWISPSMAARHGKEESIQATVLSLHYLSWGVPFKPAVFEDKGGNIVVRYNLKDLAQDPDDPKEVDAITKAMEELQFDPVFNLLLTKDTLRFGAALGIPIPQQSREEWFKKDVEPYRGEDGKLYNQKWEKRIVAVKEVELLRLVADHLDKKLVGDLIDFTQSQAPVVSAPYFMSRTLRTIKDADKNKVYASIYGGLYYDASGTPKTEKELLAKLGVNDLKVFDKLQSDRRAWMMKSLVTKHERLIEAIPTLATSLDRSPYYFATRDKRRSSIDIAKSARMNLFGFKEDGSEIIYAKLNGLPGYAILNGDRKMVDEVPNDIASDTSKPSQANSLALEAAISCISCHAKNNGFLPIKDTLRDRLKSGRVHVLDDLDAFGKVDFVRRIRSWADADFEAPNGIMARARNDFGQGVIRATGPWKTSRSKPLQLDIVQVSSEKMVEIFNSYLYDGVDAHRALDEMGVQVKKELAAVKLKELAAFPALVREDRRMIDLYEGETIPRTEFDLVRSILAVQIRRNKK